MEKSTVSRRLFLAGSAITVAAAGCATTGSSSSGSYKVRSTTQAKSGFKSPNQKLNMAAIGAGGKGTSDIQQCAALGENVVALCDADWRQAGGNFRRFDPRNPPPEHCCATPFQTGHHPLTARHAFWECQS